MTEPFTLNLVRGSSLYSFHILLISAQMTTVRSNSPKQQRWPLTSENFVTLRESPRPQNSRVEAIEQAVELQAARAIDMRPYTTYMLLKNHDFIAKTKKRTSPIVCCGKVSDIIIVDQLMSKPSYITTSNPCAIAWLWSDKTGIAQ